MTFEPKAEVLLSILGMLGSAVSWALKMKISYDIAQNNVRINKKIEEVRSGLLTELTDVKVEVGKELTHMKDRFLEKSEYMDKAFEELKASLPDRVNTITSGKYVGKALHRQSMETVNQHFEGIQRLIEVNLNNIENSMNRQIADLKERIFSSQR